MLSKGRIYDAVSKLLDDAGISLVLPERTYFPISNQKDLAFQIVKPQIASVLLAALKADVAFSGKDWVYENGVEDALEEVLDLGFDPVRIVAAIPEDANFDDLSQKSVTVATEYQRLSRTWLLKKHLSGEIFRTWGTSEGFVRDTPDTLAQILIDNTSTGTSLKANRLKVVDVLMESSTRMYASREAMADPARSKRILELSTLFKSVLDARNLVLLEMNVSKDNFDALIKNIPSMKSPTVSPLFGDGGFAVKIAVHKSDIPSLIPVLKSHGATDILEYDLRKVVP